MGRRGEDRGGIGAAVVAGLVVALAGCKSSAPHTVVAAAAPVCSDLFDQGTLRTYAIEISPTEWDLMTAEFHNLAALEAGVKFVVYHPIVFHLDNETVSDAAIKLHGQSSWFDAVTYDGDRAKMQFTISFGEARAGARFHGVGKITFDMPRSDWTFLHERLSDAWLREIGIMAPCAASGRLVINGNYYGLYVTEENVGSTLVQEYFPANPGGDLWKGAQELQVGVGNWTRLNTFWQTADVASVAAIVDLPGSVLTWAAEAALNDSDGYYGGMHNFYLYDQGSKGFLFLPTDTDSTFDWLALFDRVPFDDHPVFWWSNRAQPAPIPGPQWPIVMADAGWRRRYADAVATQIARWNVQEIQGWIDTWSAQIADAVATDPHAIATPADFQRAIATARDVAANRPKYLQTFVDCERGGGDDADGDGFKWCDDCNDSDPNIHLGAPERCGNAVDDNCNGTVDEGCGTPPTSVTGPPQ
jgi:hypothetical protein